MIFIYVELTAVCLHEDLLQGAKAAAAFTGLPERTIYHLVEKDRLPVVRLGRTLFFRRSALEEVFGERGDTVTVRGALIRGSQ